MRRSSSIHEVRHGFDDDQRRAEQVCGPSNCGALHVFDVRTVLLHELEVDVHSIQRVSCGHHSRFQSQLFPQHIGVHQVVVSHAVFVESRQRDPSIVVSGGVGQIHVSDASTFLSESTCSSYVQDELWTVLLHGQKRGQCRWHGPAVVHAVCGTGPTRHQTHFQATAPSHVAFASRRWSEASFFHELQCLDQRTRLCIHRHHQQHALHRRHRRRLPVSITTKCCESCRHSQPSAEKELVAAAMAEEAKAAKETTSTCSVQVVAVVADAVCDGPRRSADPKGMATGTAKPCRRARHEHAPTAWRR
mmetsp:Transcript_11471/g.70516  ORF Transcript_11471/g.70516 Transcript_11471/m.70516 type:complete len:304 (+) Transcript_11471:1409-2320(+)